MKTITFYLILASIILFSCEKDDISPSITSILENVNEVTIIEVEELDNGEELIKFIVKQPLDHNNPNGPFFIQNGSLLHRNYDLPLIFLPSGYGRSHIPYYNLTNYTFSNNKGSGKPNILAVDHRYYGNNGEDFENLDPSYLNIEQAAHDLHQIVLTFKQAYKNKWISMGYSKGGRTCIYHKYYFPEDVDATLSFVAPLTLQNADNRFNDFIKNIHSAEEFEKMLQFQRLLLQRRDEITPLLEDWYRYNNLVMDREADKVIEGIAIGYPFTYWQYKSYWNSNELSILKAPNEDDNISDIFTFLSSTYFLDNYSTENITKYKAYYYQSQTQTGFPLYGEYEKLSDLLKYYKTAGENPYKFDPQPIQDILNWLDKNGDNIIHFYGSKDPWTAAMYNNTPYNDALTLTHPDGDHLVDLSRFSNKNYAINKLENWTGFKIEYISDIDYTVLKGKNLKNWIKEELTTPIIPNK